MKIQQKQGYVANYHRVRSSSHIVSLKNNFAKNKQKPVGICRSQVFGYQTAVEKKQTLTLLAIFFLKDWIIGAAFQYSNTAGAIGHVVKAVLKPMHMPYD